MTDLSRLKQQTLRTNHHKEAAALVDVLKAMKAQPPASWVEHKDAGSARIDGQQVRFGCSGCSDVLSNLVTDESG